jgi:hypothetical protein
MDVKRTTWIFALLATVMLMVPMVPASPEQTREDYTVWHVSTFSDGRAEKVINFGMPGTDKSLAIALPNGARVLSATMNISGLPVSDPGPDYPENVTVDVGNDGALEYAFQGKGYGRMGYQTLFSNGAGFLNVSLPMNGGTNATPSVRLPKNAVVTSTKMDLANLRGGGGGTKVAIEAGPSSRSRDSVNNDPVYSIQTLCLANGWVANIVQGTDIDTQQELNQYSTVITGDSGSNDDDHSTFQSALDTWVQAGGGFVGMGWITYSTTLNSAMDNVLPQVCNGYSYDSSGVITITDGSHEITSGVNNVNIQQYCEYPTSGVDNGAVTLGTCPSGKQVIVYKNYGLGRSVYLGPIAFGCFQSYPNVANYYNDANFKLLLANALRWTSGKLLLNCSVDLTNNGGVDWNDPALNGTASMPDATAQFNAYLAAAQPNGTDAYGNGYVDVPIAVSSNTSGTVQLLNLSIAYQYTTAVDANPTSGNLAEGLNAVLPTKYDGKSTNIPVAVFSSHAGKVKISGLHIDYVPPVHPAIISARIPEDTVVLMDENTTMEFCITADDPYDYPMNTSWTVNGKTVLKNMFNLGWHADFDANGTYNVTVSVDNQLQKVATSWMVIVRNVNRKPIVDSFSPEKSFEMDENSSATLEVSASDPDNNPVTFTWYADGKRVLSDETVYEYKTTYSSAGKHELKVVMLDSLGASTTLAWDVTVKEVNAGPTIADSSPPGDDVSMTENSAKKFSIVDISPDLDKQFIQWSLDGNNTGVTGRSYNYSADFSSAGTHVIQAQVTDGKLSERRMWNVMVADVNRAPLAVIASPAAKAEFMLGADIVLDGSTSSDPDSDTLSMSWSEAGKPLGTGTTLTVKLAKGKHIITLSVDDGKKNGNATAQVELYVRYIDFKATLTVDVAAPTEGNKVVVSARLTNKGDGSVDELPVSFIVDGTEVASTTIESIEPDADFPLEFSWKAVKGDHTLEVMVNNQNFSKTVTVAKKPAAAAPVGGDMTWLIAVVIIAVVALAAGAVVWAQRRKNAAAQPEEDMRLAQRPEQSIPYEPVRKAPTHVPPVLPAAAHTAAAPPVPHSAPEMSEEANTREAIDNLETILQDAETAGLDTSKARQSLKIARNFFEMGKYQKAMLYCKMAEDNLG